MLPEKGATSKPGQRFPSWLETYTQLGKASRSDMEQPYIGEELLIKASLGFLAGSCIWHVHLKFIYKLSTGIDFSVSRLDFFLDLSIKL